MYLQHLLLKIRKTVLKFTSIPSTMSIVFASFKHLELPISIKISHICHYTANCLLYNLHDSYISKFELMNYFFDHLLVACL